MDDVLLIQIRPKLAIEVDDVNKSACFQSSTLRPVLKMLHDKIILFSNEQMPKLKNIEHLNERRNFVKQFFDKNPQKSAYLQGMICGFFTEDEYLFYLKNTLELNKRIKDLFIERIATSMNQ